MLSCEAALLYNVLAALGRYGEGRFGNGFLYDGSDPPVLQYNAAALIALWLNVGQCVITALMQLMLRLSIHAIDPSASLPAFGHKAARKLRVMASVISAGDGVYSEPVGETSSQRRAADKRLPARFPEITQDSSRCQAPCRQPSAGGDRLCPRLLRGAASGGASRVLRGLLPRPA